MGFRVSVASVFAVMVLLTPAVVIADVPTDGDVDVEGGSLDLGAREPAASKPPPAKKPSGDGGGENTGAKAPSGPSGGENQCDATARIGCGFAPSLEGPGVPLPPPPPNPVQLAQEAQGRLDLPAPSAKTSPEAPVKGLVGLQTWLWIDPGQWQPLTESVTAGSTTVTATVRPVGTTWDLGEGSKVCAGPGEPWRKGLGQKARTECGYTYQRTSVGQPENKYRISTVVRYQATWTCTGACTSDGGDLGLVASPAAARQLEVGERQTVVVR